jgi:hypothetical protein
VQFETTADAEDAICASNGYEFDGKKLCIELAHGGAPRGQRKVQGVLGGTFGTGLEFVRQRNCTLVIAH